MKGKKLFHISRWVLYTKLTPKKWNLEHEKKIIQLIARRSLLAARLYKTMNELVNISN